MDMEPDLGKLFVGGISWDTDEHQLRDYFQTFGDIVESFIMKDRATGRARGFGFVVFADPEVAERVIMEKHIINGRVVEAKKAVPRDSQGNVNRRGIGSRGSLGPSSMSMKKVFVGGLPSTVTEREFKDYFDKFGVVTDVVVMYDHQTQRPRGFGFVTFDSEDAVDRILCKTFHELNGRMVEVKRAVPRELCPTPSMRSPVGAYNCHGLNRVGNMLNECAMGHNLCSINGYGIRMDGKFGSVSGDRRSFDLLASLNYGVGMNGNASVSPNFNGNMGYGSVVGGLGLSPYITGNSNWLDDSLQFLGNDGRIGHASTSSNQVVWGDGGFNYNGLLHNSRAGNVDGMVNDNGINWGISPPKFPAKVDWSGAGYNSGSLDYGSAEERYGFLENTNRRNACVQGTISASLTTKSTPYDGAYADLDEPGSLQTDPTCGLGSSKLGCFSPFEYGLDTMSYDNVDRAPGGDYHDHGLDNMLQNRGLSVIDEKLTSVQIMSGKEISANQMNI